MSHLGKIFVLLGAVFFIVGFLLMFAPRIPYVGKLPGDIHIKKENVEIYIPIATSLLVSLILSGIFWLINYVGENNSIK